MLGSCKHCQSKRVAGVIDKRIEAAPTAGNKYRSICLSCDLWLPMIGAADYETADRKHILPRDVDPESDEPTVPVEEFYDGPNDLSADNDGDELADLETVADNEPPIPRELDGSDDDEKYDVHQFSCPKCGTDHEGYPPTCTECPASYDWSEVLQ